MEVLPTKLPPTAYTAAREEVELQDSTKQSSTQYRSVLNNSVDHILHIPQDESEPGIFSRKDLLTRGEGVLRWQGNR